VGDVHLERHRDPCHLSLHPHTEILSTHPGPTHAALGVIQNLPKNGSYRPSYKEMLRFYSYYKQATMGPCLVPQPGFWDPIGRYKWDAWNSLGKMSREQAMSAYITEMKLVAQRTFLKRVTGWKEQVLNGDAEPAPEPPCLPKEPAPPSPESQPPRDQDSEVFCDSMEQLEPELVWAETGALGGELNTRNSTESPAKKGRLESTLLGPQELDTWLVGTVRALQESMRDVQGRLQSLESMAVPCKQPLLSLSPRLCLLTPLPSPENGVAHGAGKEVRGSVVHPAWKWERPSFPALISLCLKKASAQCQALAPQALCSHAALLPPVALHRPVALPTVSDTEEVTLNGGVCSQRRRL
ncbi:hypothetical protein E2I00_017320, partial [Balaenoptera physalus]